MESSEAAAIYSRIVDYMETYFELHIPPGMRQVPILAVDLQALNEHKSNAAGEPYCHGNQSTIRGLTMSTCGEIRHMSQASARFDRASGSFLLSAAAPTVLKIEEVRDVTAVLVLYGLPEELTSSILAHEAMHVYMKLSKDVPFHLPAKLEEGLCQVVAFRFLKEIGEHKATGASNALSEADFDCWQQQALLRSYLMHQIATDPSAAYGDGYREAAVCVDALGLQVVVDCVKDTKSLPVI